MDRPLLIAVWIVLRAGNQHQNVGLGESARVVEQQKGAGPCATEPCEPRQVRKEATVSGQFCVPQDHLAPLSSMKTWAQMTRSALGFHQLLTYTILDSEYRYRGLSSLGSQISA